MHVVVVGVDHASPLRGADGVLRDGGERACIDSSALGRVEHGKVLLVVAGEHVGLNGANEGIATGTTHLGEEQEVSSDGGNVLMTNADLGGNLEGDTEKTTTHTLKNLGEDSLDVGGARGTVFDHKTNAEQSNASTRDHNPLVVLSAEGKEAGSDTEDGQGKRLTVGEVGSTCVVVTHDDERPIVGRNPRSVEAEEVEEADGGGKVDIVVEPPSPVKDRLWGHTFPYTEADEHDTADNEHGDDPAGRPTVGLELGEVDRKKDEEEADADEEEAEGINVNEEVVNGGQEGHVLVRARRDEAHSSGPPLVDGKSENDGEGSDGSANAEEAGTPSPVNSNDLWVDLSRGPEVDDIGKADKADGGASPLGRDVVGQNDLLHDLDTSVAKGINDGTTGDITSVLCYGDDDKAKHPKKDGESVGLSTTENVGELSDGELADSDNDSLNNRDGGIGGVVVERRGGVGLPSPHGVVIETVKVGDERNAENAHPEGPIGYSATSFSSDDTDLLVGKLICVVMRVMGGIPMLDVFGVERTRHVEVWEVGDEEMRRERRRRKKITNKKDNVGGVTQEFRYQMAPRYLS